MTFELSYKSGKGPESLKRKLAALAKFADKEFLEATEDAKKRVVRIAQQKAPVDTGKLESSIEGTVKTDGDNIVMLVGSPVEYAIYVEAGTSKMAAQPYLRPALEQGLEEYEKDIGKAIGRAARTAG